MATPITTGGIGPRARLEPYRVSGRNADIPPFPAIFDLVNLNGSNGFGRVGIGADRDEANGSDVAGIGDINGDGFDDVLSSASYTGGIYDGEVALTIGTNVPQPALGRLDHFFSTVCGEYEYLGRVSGAGDINGDGFADFIASGRSGSLRPAPANYIVSGNTDLADLPYQLGSLNGSNGFKVEDGVVSAAGDNVVITYSTASTITISGHQLGDLNAGDFQFT